MALIVHPTPGDGPRRSSRIRVRRQSNLARSSCLLTHTHPAVSPHLVPRSLARDPTAPSVKDLRAGPPTSKSGFRPSPSPSTSQCKRSRSPQPHNARTRASSTPASASASRTRPHSKKSVPVSEPSVLAGRKRKRSPATDAEDEPAYELVSAHEHEHERAGSDEEAQTPRQLRYAKRQRLLVSRAGNLAPSPAGSAARNLKGERVLQRASTEGRLLSPQSPANPAYAQPETCTVCKDKDVVVPDTPCPQERVTLRVDRPPFEAAVKCDAPSPALDAAPPAPVDPEDHDYSPTITPLRRLPLPPRDRRPDMTDQGVWKTACQERVEYLKDVYREVFEAVLRAEALTAQCQRFSEAPGTATADAPLGKQAEFKLYTPATCPRTDADGDGDTDTDMDVGYSSDWDSDEDEDEDEDDDDDDDDLMDTDTYDAVIALDNDGPAQTTGTGTTGKLPRLASVRVYALEAVPEQTARNGVPFMGRGTPVDRARRADWAAPPQPCFAGFSEERQWPPQQFFAPAPQSAFQVDVGVYESAYGASQMHVDEPYAPAEPWLDPALRAESASPSQSPSPVPVPVPSSSGGIVPSFAPPPLDYSSVPVGHDIPSASPELLSSSLSSSSSAGSEASVSSGGSASTGWGSEASTGARGSPSPTGCAWHATFLQCLQSPGCPPFFASAPASAPTPTPTHLYAAPAPPVLPVPDPISGHASDVLVLTPFIGPAPLFASEPSLSPISTQTPTPMYAAPHAAPHAAAVSGHAPSPSPSPVLVLTPFIGPAPSYATTSIGGVGAATMGAGAGAGMFPNQELAQFVRSHFVPGSVTLGHALG